MNKSIEPAVREAFSYMFGHYGNDPRIAVSFDKLRALLASPAPAEPKSVPDGVWEALQRLIENGLMAGPASAEDARTVAMYRDRSTLLAAAQAAPAVPAGEALNLPAVVAAHVKDLRGCIPALREHDMGPSADEFAKAADELEAALSAPQTAVQGEAQTDVLAQPKGTFIGVHQTRLGERGNCFAACLASILGLSLDAVPDFLESGDDESDWWNAARKWLRSRGLGLILTEDASAGWRFDGYYIAAGPSPRGIEHATVYRRGKLAHDPHPDGAGLAKATNFAFISPIAMPAAEVCRFPDCRCPMDPGPAPDWCAKGLPHQQPSGVAARAAPAAQSREQPQPVHSSAAKGLMPLIVLNELAKVYASSYASPHHITFTVEGLRNFIAAASDTAAGAQKPDLSGCEIMVDREGVSLESGKPFGFTCCDCGLTHRCVIVSEDDKPVGFAIERVAAGMSAPEEVVTQQGCACLWQGDVVVSRCELHEAWHTALHEWADRARTAEAALAAAAGAQKPNKPELDAAPLPAMKALVQLFRENEIPMSDRNSFLWTCIEDAMAAPLPVGDADRALMTKAMHALQSASALLEADGYSHIDEDDAIASLRERLSAPQGGQQQ